MTGYRNPRVRQILVQLDLVDIFFENESPEEISEHERRVIRYLSFAQGRSDSQMWYRGMDGEKEMPQILGDLISEHTFNLPFDGLGHGYYHELYRDLAMVEGATGLDLTSEPKLKGAVANYWNGVKKTIQLFKLQYTARKQDEQAKLVSMVESDTPSLEPDILGQANHLPKAGPDDQDQPHVFAYGKT